MSANVHCSKCDSALVVFIANEQGKVEVWWCPTCQATKCEGTGEIKEV